MKNRLSLNCIYTLIAFLISVQSFAANRYWVGTSSNKNWNTTANWSATSGGVGGAAIPTTLDLVYFNSAGSGQCIINAVVFVKQITIDATYTDTVKQNGFAVTIGGSGLVQNGGVFWCTSGAVTVQGSLTLAGGTFRSTSGRLTLLSDYIPTSGNFIHNNGEVYFNGSLTVKGASTFYDCTFAPVAAAGLVTLDASLNMTVEHLLTHTGVTLGGTGVINAHGDILQNGTLANNAGGTSTILINGTGNQTFTGTTNPTYYNTGCIYGIKINKTTGTLFLKDVIRIGGVWELVAGTVDITTNTSTVNFYYGSSSVCNVIGNVVLSNVFITSSSTLTTNLTIAAGNSLTVNGTLYTMGTGIVKYTGTISVTGNLSILNTSTSSGGGGAGTILMTGNGNQLIAGNATPGMGRLGILKIDKTGGVLSMKDNITIGVGFNYVKGTIDITSYRSTLVFGYGTNKTISGKANVDNVLFWGDINSENNIPATDTLTVNGELKFTGSGSLTLYTGVIKAMGDVTTTATGAAYNGSTTTILISGPENQTLNGSASKAIGWLPKIIINKPSTKTLFLNGFINSEGNWIYQNGIVDPQTSTVVFGYTTGGKTISGNHSLYNVSMYGFNSTAINIASTTTLTVLGELAYEGTYILNVNGGTINAKGNVTGSNTFAESSTNYSGGTTVINICGTGNQTLTGNSIAGKGKLSSITVNKTAGTLFLKDYVSVAGNWSNVQGTVNYTSNTNTVIFGKSPGRTITGNPIFGNLSIVGDNTSLDTIPLTDTVTVNGNLRIEGAAIVGIHKGTINAKGNITLANTNTSNYTQTGLINICGSGDQTLTSNGTYNYGNLGNVNVNKPEGTLTLAGEITLKNATWKYIRGTVNPGTSTLCFAGCSVYGSNGSSFMNFNDVFIYSSTTNLYSNLYVKKVLSIDISKTLVANSNDICVGGRYTNLGTFTQGTGIFTFNGSADQYVYHGATAETFTNLKVNKPSGKVRLACPVTVSGSLNLVRGVIVTTATNYLGLTDNATATGGSNASYVVGPFKKTGDDAFTFPLGDTVLTDTVARYHLFAMTAPTGTASAFTAQYFAKNQLTDHPTFTSVASTLKPISNCEYWALIRSASTSVITPTLGWNANVCNMGTLGNMRVASWSGTQWTDLGQNSTTGTTLRGTIKAASAGPNTANQYYALAENNVNIQLYPTYCNASIPITNQILAADNNASQALYRFEFSTSSTFAGYVDTDTSFYKEISSGQFPLFKTVSGLRIGNTYYSRIRTRSNSSQPWSNPGTICSVTFINNVKLVASQCDQSFAIAYPVGMDAADDNLMFAQYRFEFSTTAAFTGYDANDASMYKEITRGQYKLYNTVSGLQIGSTYYVRIRVRENASETWSAAGPVCSVTFMNDVKLLASQCDQSISIANPVGMQTSDANLSYAYYRYEFSTVADFSNYNASDASMYKELSNGQYPLYKSVSGLQLDHTYYVRIRVRANVSDAWSSPGATCSVTFINDVKLIPSQCDQSISIANPVGMQTLEANLSYDSYRFEFSTAADFSNYNASDVSMYKEFSAGQYPLYKTVSGLHIDHTYYVRIRLKINGSTSWSTPGAVCSVSFINDLKLSSSYCNNTVSASNLIVANDNNLYYGFYRFEFSASSIFTGYNASDASMYKEMAIGEALPAFSTVTGLQNNNTYYVRVRVRETTGESWSTPGGICSFTITTAPAGNQRYWIGNGTDKNWSNTANWSATSGGAGGAAVPTNADYVYFNAGGNGDLILDANVDVKMFNMLSSYAGSIQQNGKTIAVGSDGIFVNGGTFLGSNADILDNGSFTLTGGSFRSTSTKLTIAGNYSDGTTTGFIHNSGTVYFPSSKTISGRTNFYDLKLNPTVAATYTVSDTVTVSDSLVYMGSGGISLQTGTINVTGNIANNNTGVSPTGSGSGWIHICGSGNQTYTGNHNSDPNSFAGSVGNIKINKASGTLTLDKNITLLYASEGGDYYWQYVRGTVNAGTSLVTFIGTKGHITSINGSNSMAFNNLRVYSGETHLSTDVTILGNLTQDGLLNAEAHTIDLKGNFIHNGEFRYEGSTVSFTGSSNQRLIGSIPYSVFNKVVVNKPSGKLYLDHYILVITDLSLQKGVVVGSAANYIEIYNEATLTGGSKQSYVNGAINKICNYNTDFTYTLGDTAATDSVYHPFRVSLPGGGYAFKAQYVAKNVLTDHPTFTAKDGSLSSISSCEYWSITRTTGPAIAILPTLSLKSNTCMITPLTDMRVAGWDGSQWKNMGQGSLTGTALSGTVQALAPGLTNESQYYTLATFSSFDRYWIGNNANKDWNNSANWSLTSGGTPGASIPTNTDAVYFNAGGSGDLILDANVDVKMFNMLSSYVGSIQQNGKTIAVGTDGMVVSGGTFLGDNADIMDNGSFTLTGGSFRSTSTKLTIAGNYSDGTTTGFIHNSGTVYFPSSKTISGRTNFYDLKLNPTVAATYTVSDTVTVSDSLVYMGSGGISLQTGTINVTGNIANNNTGVSPTGSGSGWIHICGSGNQTYTGNHNSDPSSFAGSVGNIKINKASGTLTLDKNITLLYASEGGDYYWQYVRGTVNAGTSLVTFIGTKGHITSINGSNSMAFNNLRVYSGETHLSTDVTILGNLTQDGLLNAEAHTIDLKGNFIHTGEFRYEGSTVSFTGSSNQRLIGSIPYSVFNKVVVNKPSGKLYLDHYILVITDLSLQKGVVVGSAANYVEISNEATLTGGSKQSYVNGAINKICNYNTDFTYTLGDTTASDSSAFHPFRTTIPGGGYAFKAQYITKNVLTDHPTFTTKASTLNSISTCEYWSVTRTAGPTTIVPILGWNANSCNIQALSDLRVASWNGTQWDDLGQSSTAGNSTIGRITASTSGPDQVDQYYVIAESKSTTPIASFNAGNTRTLAPAIEWSKTFGGNNYEDVRSIITTRDGGYMFLGNTYSSASGDVTDVNRGALDYWVVKLDGSGTLLWSKNLGSAGFDAPYGMNEDSDGGALIIGQAGSGTGDFSTLVGSGPNDMVIAKLDAAGNIGWLKLIGGNSGDLGTSIKHLSSGYLVTGLSQSATGDIHDAGNGDADGVIIKLDNDRNIQWLKVIGTPGYDFVSEGVELPNGDIVVAGAKTTATNGEDYLIMKLTSSGTVIWEKTYGGTGEDDANNIAIVNGGFVVSGYAYSTDGAVSGAATGPNIWTIRIDDNGDLVWQKVFGGNGVENCNGQVVTPDGGSISGGYTTSNDHGITTTVTAKGDRDNLLVKFRSNGEVEWFKTFGDGMHERIYDMASTPDGGFITGSLYSTKDGSDIAAGRGTGDALITKLSEPAIAACINSSITFSNASVNATTYLWKVNNVSAGTSSDLTYTFTTAGTYTISLTASNGSLSSTKNSIVMISGGVTASAGPAVSTSAGSGITIGGTPTALGGLAPYGYLWAPVTGLSSATIANPISSISTTTGYTVLVSDASGCTASASVQVTIEDYKSYGELKKALDAGYYQVNSTDHMLYFKYTEEYKSGNLTFKIYDSHHDLKSCPTVINKQYGDNRIGIDLMSCLGASTSTYYILEVINDKSEKLLLKFKY